MGTSDTFIYKEIFIDKVYKRSLKNISPDSIIIDIGSNIGLSSLFFAPYCKKIIAVEAAPDNFELSLLNIKASAYNNKISCLNFALWSTSDIYLQLQNCNTQRHAPKIKISPNNNNSTGIKTVTLRDILNSYQLSYCDFLKMDIEGAEFEVLLTDPDILDSINSIIMEYHQDITNKYHYTDLINLIKSKYNEALIEPDKNNITGLIFASRYGSTKNMVPRAGRC